MLVCVSYVSVCAVFVVLLVASVLASMRWLLCVSDGSKKKEVIRPSFFFFSESSYDNSSGGFGCSRTFFQLSVSSHHVSLSLPSSLFSLLIFILSVSVSVSV